MNAPLDFSFNVNDVDTSAPVLVEGSYIVRVEQLEIVENKDKTGHNLKATFVTTAPATSTEAIERGERDNVKPGYKLSRWFPLQAKPGSDHDFRKGLCELVDAALGTKQGERPDITPDLLFSLKGKEMVASVKVRTDTEGQYAGRSSNDISRLRHLS